MVNRGRSVRVAMYHDANPERTIVIRGRINGKAPSLMRVLVTWNRSKMALSVFQEIKDDDERLDVLAVEAAR